MAPEREIAKVDVDLNQGLVAGRGSSHENLQRSLAQGETAEPAPQPQQLALKGDRQAAWLRGRGESIADHPAAAVTAAAKVETGAALESIPQSVISAVHTGQQSVSRVASLARYALPFLKSMSDSLGLTDLAVGLYESSPLKMLQNVYQLGRGELSFGEFMAASAKSALGMTLGLGRAALGLAKLAYEALGPADVVGFFKEGFTGLVGLGKAGLAFLNGDLAGAKALMIGATLHLGMAGMHAIFAAASIGAITATIATGGAAAGALVGVIALRASLKTAAKAAIKVSVNHVVEHGAKQLGKAVVSEAAEKLSAEVLEKASRESVDQGVKDLAKQVSKHGEKALSHESMQAAMRESTAKVVEKTLREAGVDKIVEKHVFAFLQQIDKKSVKEITSELEGMGVKNAKKVAEELQSAVRGGKADKELKQILEDGISAPLRQHIEAGMEKEFKKRLRKSLYGELDDESSQVLAKAVREQSERLGKSAKEHADELVESGWKGAKEGIEKAVRKVVREGIENAFKKFRHRHQNLGLSASEQPERKSRGLAPAEKEETSEVKKAAQALENESRKRSEGVNRSLVEHKSVIAEVGGEQVKLNYAVLPDGKLELESREVISIREAAQKAIKDKVA